MLRKSQPNFYRYVKEFEVQAKRKRWFSYNIFNTYIKNVYTNPHYSKLVSAIFYFLTKR